MRLELSEDQEFFRETTRRFLESEAPLTRVRELADTAAGFDRGWWLKAGELGWTGLFVPEAHGGGSLSGSPLVDAVIVAEELGRLVAPGPFLPVNVVAAALAASGSDEQQAEVLPRLGTGEVIATWAFAETGSPWDSAGVGLVAEPAGDGFILTGTKVWVEAAAEADQFLVTARTGDGITQLLVPAGTDGVVVTPGRSMDLVRRYGSVRFDGAQLPASAVVGNVGGAAADAERQLQIALSLQCAETVGAIDRVFEFTVEYMQERFAFGRPIASFQALKHRVADMLLWVESAKATSDGAAEAIDAGAADAPLLVRAAKAYVGVKSLEILQDCVQLHGGIGVTWEHDLHLYLRRVTVNRAVYGTPEHHQERICRLLEI
jgi:alkylation response protein AidB-like acyl-CoA dehydrogenase